MSIASGMQITPALRGEWLAERRRSIGASEAAAALGLDPHRSPLELYLQKTGALPPEEPGEAAQWGLRLEPLIAEAWQERTGRRIVERQVFLRAIDDPLSATIDAMDADCNPIEFKTISALRARDALGDEGSSELPPTWVVQAHLQMALACADAVEFAVLVGGQELRTYTVPRDNSLLAVMLPGLREFWGRVERRDAPPPTVPTDARLMAALHPGAEGEVEFDDVDALAVREYVEIGRKIKVLEGQRDLAKAGILQAMGSASRAKVPGLGTLTRKVVSVGSATLERKAYTFTDLRLKKGGDCDGQQ